MFTNLYFSEEGVKGGQKFLSKKICPISVPRFSIIELRQKILRQFRYFLSFIFRFLGKFRRRE